jgi:hypothetical protein
MFSIERVFCRSLTVAMYAAAICAPAWAEEPSGPIRLGGFGTVGASYHATEGLDYRRSLDQSYGARGGRLDTGLDSVFGLQLNLTVSDSIEVVTQGVTRRNADNTWEPSLNWAFLKFSPDDSWSVRVGRVGVETSHNSDSRLIGYSYLPVRPAPELLGSTPQDWLDGFDVLYRRPVGDALFSAKAFHGYQAARVNGGAGAGAVRIPQNDVTGLFFGVIAGDLHVRFGGGIARIRNNGDTQPLIDGLRATGLPSALAAAHQLDAKDRMVRFGLVDAALERGPWRLYAAHFRQDAPDDSVILVDTRSLSALAGYRLGDFTPYATASHVTTSRVAFSTGLPSVAPLDVLDRAALATADGAQFSQRSLGLGVRWDFAPNRALKVQVDRVHAGVSPLVRDTYVPPRNERALTLLSFTFDFVF